MNKFEKWLGKYIRKYHLTVPIIALTGMAVIWIGIKMWELTVIINLILELIR